LAPMATHAQQVLVWCPAAWKQEHYCESSCSLQLCHEPLPEADHKEHYHINHKEDGPLTTNEGDWSFSSKNQ